MGKTNLSIQLAKSLNAEIISGDSMQVYKGMDIGTAKINEQEMEAVPHHLIDILDPQDSFSTADYQSLVRNKISEIAKRGKLPMIVGGTGLYIQSVLYDYTFTEEANDPAFRQSLQVAAVRKALTFFMPNLLRQIQRQQQRFIPIIREESFVHWKSYIRLEKPCLSICRNKNENLCTMQC